MQLLKLVMLVVVFLHAACLTLFFCEPPRKMVV